MSSFNDDMARGCLANGEPLEAKYGSGWWSGRETEREPDPFDQTTCEDCGRPLMTYYGIPEPCLHCDWII